ncbi:glycosyltransferase family 2 protein [Eisenibacter elegans]|jgi:glycosyltransferase involved in cell wall biosynthesis|uniref:glycosyltransferase family 2 protein n=1 Tax=Eisenibacter elegans TaxID=997 RepID=UPI000412B2E4|nr:glycosyltransferase family 2 protein [Eisenibacter elegans]
MSYAYDISVVVPLLNEAESLPELCAWIDRVMQAHQFDYELIMVDDGSRDNSWEVIQQLSQQYPTLRGIRFTRNYGKSAALHTGFKLCRGEVVITLDADLQDIPDEIPELYTMLKTQGYDMISGWKQKRQDPLSKTLPTKLFNYVTRLFSGIKLHDFNCGLKAYRAPVVQSIELYGEMHRYIPVLAKWAGFERIGEKKVQHQARKYGYTKFGLERFLYGFLDLLSITFVTRFRKRPMHFFGTMGVLSFMAGFVIACWLIAEQFFGWNAQVGKSLVTNRPLFYLALVAIIVGVQLFMAGFLGELLATHQHRQNDYLVAERLNLSDENTPKAKGNKGMDDY